MATKKVEKKEEKKPEVSMAMALKDVGFVETKKSATAKKAVKTTKKSAKPKKPATKAEKPVVKDKEVPTTAPVTDAAEVAPTAEPVTKTEAEAAPVTATEEVAPAAEVAVETSSDDVSHKIAGIKGIEVSGLSDEELAREAEALKNRRMTAIALGKKLLELYQAEQKILAVRGWRDSEVFSEQMKINAGVRESLLEEYESIKDSATASFLFSLVRASEPTDDGIVKVMRMVVKHERGEMQRSETARRDGRYPRNAVIFKDHCLVPKKSCLDDNERQTGTDFGLFAELRKLVQRYYNALRVEEAKKIQTLKSLAAEENLEKFLAGEPETYQIHFPERKDQKTGKQQYEGGVGIVSLEHRSGDDPDRSFLIIRVEDGAGSLRFMANLKNYWIPFSHIFKSNFQADTSRLPHGIEARDVERLVRTIRKATASMRQAHWKKNNPDKATEVNNES